MKEFKDGVNCV